MKKTHKKSTKKSAITIRSSQGPFGFNPLALLLVLLIIIAFGIYIIFQTYAKPNSQPPSNQVDLYLSPSSQTVSVGAPLTVAIYENSLTNPVNAVQADLSYDPSVLQYQSVDNTGSGFSVAAQATGGGGTVSIAKGSTTSLTGQQLVAIVNFMALTKFHHSSISFTSGSALVASTTNTNILQTTLGGQYSAR